MKKINIFLIKILTFCLVFGFLLVLLNTVFTILSPPFVSSSFPKNNAEDVSVNSAIIIKFDKPVKRQEIQSFIFPEVYGEWRFTDPLFKKHFFKTLVFSPAVDFEPDTQYLVRVENIKGFGLGKSITFQFAFKTQTSPETLNKPEEEEKRENEIPLGPEITEPVLKVTMLNIPLDWQDYPLSCEAASLKMALAWKGVFVLEDEIMEKIGYDLTPRKNNIWGDPYQIYVGNINGKICSSGYGVYWEPVARAASFWRKAEYFSNRGLEDLIKEIELGNPVIVWGVLPVGSLTDCSWYTPEGKYIKAFKETHTRLVIGFIGPPDSPSKIILNDPLAGRLYWEVSYFLKNWEVFDYSGVVIR